ncbi:hypothetical protein IJT17_10855 [bacterium]|nr:hypothetical protein [bacterium]
MNYVQAFITNISFPQTLNELCESYYRFDMETILGIAPTPDEEFCKAGGWTAPRWAKTDDIVFFYHAKRANRYMTPLITELHNSKDDFEEDVYWALLNSFYRAKSLWHMYGGKIFAVGRVADKLAVIKDNNFTRHWASSIYAPIDSIFLLEKPIDISDFKDVIRITRDGTITPVFGNSFDYLKSSIIANNKDVREFFINASAQPIPFKDITKDNWLSVVNPYRRRFLLEAQFRAYYVDYLLPFLGDRKTFYSECPCKKTECPITYVDNVIQYQAGYLPVEVKLNVEIEKDLISQLKQYMHVNTVGLTKDKTVSGDSMFPYVMAIDTENIYLYDGSKLEMIWSLDNLNDLEDVYRLKQSLSERLAI